MQHADVEEQPLFLDSSLSSGRYIIFDLETTGGNPERNGITEIFALKWYDGQIVDTFYSLVNPQIPIPPIVRRMTGITNAMVKDAPTIRQVMPKFVEFLGNDILVSHNTIGDMKFLVHFADRVCKHKLDNFYLCTHLLSEKLLAAAPDKSLQGLANYLNVPNGTVHRAEADTYLTWEVFKVLLDKVRTTGAQTIADAIRLQGDLYSRLRLGWMLDKNLAETLPSRPGVLEFLDRQNRLLFLTSSSDMRRQFKELSNANALPKMLQKTILLSARLEHKETSDLLSAMLEEARIAPKIKQGFLPLHWHLRFVWAICAVEVGPDRIALKVSHLCEHTRAAWGPIYDRKSAQTCLDTLAKEFGVPCSNKHGLQITKNQLPLVSAWFSKNPDAEGYFHPSSLLSLKVLFNGAYRHELMEKRRLSEALRGQRCNLRLQPLLQTCGLLIKAPQGSAQATLIPVVGSLPAAGIAVPADWRSWLTSTDQGKQVVKELIAQEAANQERAYSAAEAYTANALQWLVTGTKVQKHSDYRFYPLAKLPRPAN